MIIGARLQQSTACVFLVMHVLFERFKAMEPNNAYLIVLILVLAMLFQQLIQQSRYNSDIIDKLLGAVNVNNDPRQQKNTIGEQSIRIIIL